MDSLTSLERVLAGRGRTAGHHVNRSVLSAIEHETKLLPADFVRADGSLDLYEDVLKLFRPIFVGNQPAIQCGGWLGYIPLNERYALDVDSRVPVGNLERLIARAGDYVPKVLHKYSRYFVHTTDRPAAIFDFLTDQLLDAFERLWKEGLIKVYQQRDRVSSSPVGRIDPFEGAWRTAKAGNPVAASSAFHRTPDHGANRVIRFAFERLLQRYLEVSGVNGQRLRIQRIRQSIDRLDGVGHASILEVTPQAMAQYLRRLPIHHEHYADVFRIVLLVLADVGLAIRNSDGIIPLPTILINMATVFEDYARRLLAEQLEGAGKAEVKDGNRGGNGGAKGTLFENIKSGIGNPPVTPDIVIEIGGAPRLIIDAKYKPPQDIPDRSDINQVICYGARYGCENVMILYAGRSPRHQPVERVGKIGPYWVYAAYIDLGGDRMDEEEEGLVNAIEALL